MSVDLTTDVEQAKKSSSRHDAHFGFRLVTPLALGSTLNPVNSTMISTALVASRDAVEITVADTGHGVTSELKEKLFLPYFSTRKRGTGLGMSVVRQIIELHGGTIDVQSEPAKGTTFTIDLPLHATDAAP